MNLALHGMEKMLTIFIQLFAGFQCVTAEQYIGQRCFQLMGDVGDDLLYFRKPLRAFF